ncbi:hypothetical protein MYCTH_102133 [Thermothelomyces thermophilus ATCC 42464]|uniref:Uncharacterized protein n=1 Tax=Thermothelomyces thermophilus (strain ATCC 42464 / BCRC 31852 / DSM 1799) TaxID=573729 RepID=G2QCD5_THET4|nr:uncharacterized protein MYCTH_102133 [Thermothelomyces thermophilus ATCC 42464]AEO57310.1 hypothetical protein MYCTH_102133 [Thermothelomyces thermophilus ATCC 42464]
MNLANHHTFCFGIEIELLLESPSKKHRTWEALAQDLSKRLKAAGIRNHVHDNHGYAEWSIVREVTVQDPDGRNPYQYGVELVSPIHVATSLPILAAQLCKIFAVVNTISTPIKSRRCSSHVHVSRRPILSPQELAALAKAALYFEAALDALMPPERSGPHSHWAQSNRHANNPCLAGLTLAECLAKVDAAAAAHLAAPSLPLDAKGEREGKEIGERVEEDRPADARRPLVETMNLVSRESRYGVVRRKKAHFVRGKTYKWDFTGLLAPPRGAGEEADHRGIDGTVEFRQPPGSRTAAEAVTWATLAVAFVAGAVELGTAGVGLGSEAGGVVGEEGGSREELWKLLEKGREALGWVDLRALDGLFWGLREE